MALLKTFSNLPVKEVRHYTYNPPRVDSDENEDDEEPGRAGFNYLKVDV